MEELGSRSVISGFTFGSFTYEQGCQNKFANIFRPIFWLLGLNISEIECREKAKLGRIISVNVEGAIKVISFLRNMKNSDFS